MKILRNQIIKILTFKVAKIRKIRLLVKYQFIGVFLYFYLYFNFVGVS